MIREPPHRERLRERSAKWTARCWCFLHEFLDDEFTEILRRKQRLQWFQSARRHSRTIAQELLVLRDYSLSHWGVDFSIRPSLCCASHIHVLLVPGPDQARPTQSALFGPKVKSTQNRLYTYYSFVSDPNKRKELTQSRNKILHRIRALLRNEGDLYWQHKAEAVDALRPDARSYFNAIKQLKALRNPDKPSPVRLANDSGENVTNVNWNLEEFSKYFASVFYRSDQPTLFPAQPNSKAKDEPFTSEEIRKAIMHQKIGGAVGCDGISAALLRTASTVITPWLTTLFNSIKELHYCPPDLRCGLLVPVYKRGKPMGAPKSYRPVMLLSVVRKVLTRIITMRSQQSTTSYVRESQAGFTPGRSTADGVFYTRVMCERALLGDWKYSAALLDFSGAFDTIVREKALARFSDSGAATDVVATLISDTTVRVKLSSHLGKALLQISE